MLSLTHTFGRVAAIAVSFGFFVTSGIVLADDVYIEPQSFLDEAFKGLLPSPAVLWLDKAQRTTAEDILQHPLGMLRVRYWKSGTKTAWILDEIGKKHPITVGVIVNDGAIVSVAVLVYRESIGWEVRHRFFTQQFAQARLNDRLRLSNPINGISGATLSVRAVTAVARLALYFHSEVSP